ISVGKGTYEVGEVMRVCYRVSTGGTIQLSDLLSDGSARVIHARTAPPLSYCFDRDPLSAPTGGRRLRLELRDGGNRLIASDERAYTVVPGTGAAPPFDVQRVPLKKGPLGIALDPSTGAAWVTVYDSDTVYVISANREAREYKPNQDTAIGRGPFDVAI